MAKAVTQDGEQQGSPSERKEGSASVIISGGALSMSGATIMMSSHADSLGFLVGGALVLMGNLCSAYGGYRYCLAKHS